MLRLEHLDRAEIYQARRYLEPNIAALAAGGLDAETRVALQANLTESERRLAASRPAFTTNLEFHRLVAGSCGNRILTLTADAILELLRAVESRKPSDPTVNREARDAHAAIFDALLAGDADRARAAMDVHLERLERSFVASRPARGARGGP
jgi:GntR family transcriptional repressor for pyruvate dehydrogenase complex